ncbi:hypothetical protein GCM10011494_12200 [Novosphingobium endophyticum]|uniref:Outer membrane beta-barrel protein n=1 Tax=Novosphingobium endophyticum TaxID=1955250 RepID=A0A916TQV7_9SPHN|nr:outer membrane beta-barrel protein [Novosphingobium endophyticum]GGB95300.1 hypothetical protein GCM10011494_12200 [Novosphingobium endophyticum]
MKIRTVFTGAQIVRAIACPCIPVVAFGALSAPALAQRYDPFDQLGSLRASDNPLDDERPDSVTGRPRPEYAAVPIQAGSLQIMPQVLVGLEADSNVYAVDDGRTSDAILTFRPRISVSRPSPVFSWSVAGEYAGARYFDLTEENRDDYAFRGGVQYQIGSNTVFIARALQARNSEQRSSPDSVAGIVRPNRFHVTEAYGDLSHTFNRVSIRGTVDFERVNYIDNFNGAGEIIDQDFRDRSTVTGNLILEYTVSPSFALFAAGSANKRDYRTRTDLVPARDSKGYELALGSSFEISRLMHGTIRVGYMRQNYEDPLFNDRRSLLVRGEVAYYLTPLVTLTAKVDRRTAETGVREAAGYVRTNASLRADYELKRNLLLHLEAGNEHRSFVSLDRKDNRFSASFGSTWLLSPRWSVRTDFSHRRQNSSGTLPGREFHDNQVSIGVVFKGL